MGFWGTYVVGRSDRPLPELDALKTSAECVMGVARGADGWQAVQIHRAPQGWDWSSPLPWLQTLVAVMEETGRPVLGASVYDSDGARLVGYSREAGRWNGWLGLDRIIMHLDPDAVPYGYEDADGEWQVDEGEEYQQRVAAAKERLHVVVPPAHLAAPQAVRWAADAGYTPDCTDVELAMNNEDVFVEDQFFRVLDALGLPGFA